MKTASKKRKDDIITRQPFLELAKQQNIARPLAAALKEAYNWTNSTMLTIDELCEGMTRWLGIKNQSDIGDKFVVTGGSKEDLPTKEGAK